VSALSIPDLDMMGSSGAWQLFGLALIVLVISHGIGDAAAIGEGRGSISL